MTKLVVFRNGEHFFGYSCEGHSGFAQEGEDIVCAAVSTAIQLTSAYLVKYHEEDIMFSVDEQNALIKLECKRAFAQADKQISVLIDFASELQAQYSDYFTFDYLEV